MDIVFDGDYSFLVDSRLLSNCSPIFSDSTFCLAGSNSIDGYYSKNAGLNRKTVSVRIWILEFNLTERSDLGSSSLHRQLSWHDLEHIHYRGIDRVFQKTKNL